MDTWFDRLAGADDEYLTGISNKGIVKRAYKDKAEGDAKILGVGEEEATLIVGKETVTVRYPLGDSKCTCPSRSICRHVVQAILVLREHCLAEEETGAFGEAENPGQGMTAAKDRPGSPTGKDNSGDPTGEDSTGSPMGLGSLGSPTEDGQNGCAEGEPKGKTISRQNDSKPASREDVTPGKSAVWREILEYPYGKLKKALGVRQFQAFGNQAAAGVKPRIRSASVVTVQLPGQDYVVKLLSPLAYSTCSCHKKELCVHKAQAILWCQLEAGVVTKEGLLAQMGETKEYDTERVREAAGQMKAFLEELLATGLSRTSPDVLDYLERLAIISHNEGLARFEGFFRTLSDSYDRYFARKASFQTEELMAQITRLYRRAGLLGQAEDGDGVAKLAGEFRADYLPAGSLDLIGIAMDHFKSQAGYEGDTVYFLEENTKKWYTYTNARPIFYDTPTGRGSGEKRQAPWGLNLSLEDLLKVRIHLTGAKCDLRNRLSSSQGAKGEVIGEQKLSAADIGSWYYRDFDKLFAERIQTLQRGWLAEQEDSGDSGEETAGDSGAELVFVQPWECAKATFSGTHQVLTLPLYDRVGRELLVEITYSKRQSSSIRYLERISEKKCPCFLGKIYLRDGRMRMYPVDLMELEVPFGEGDKEEERSQAPGRAAQKERRGRTEQEGDGNQLLSGQERGDFITGTQKYERMENLAKDVSSLMEDLCQSGFDTVHDSTLKEIRESVKLTEQYGMVSLSRLLDQMAEQIETSRHCMEKERSPMAGIYTDINEYLYFWKQKTAYDRGRSYYCEGRGSAGTL